MVRIWLPGIPPSVNHAYRRFVDKRGRVRRMHTAEAREWVEDARWAAKVACQQAGWRPVEEKVVVRIWVRWPDARWRDSDNLFKLLLDALAGPVYVDDHWALPQVQDWTVDRANPGILVEVERLAEVGVVAWPA